MGGEMYVSEAKEGWVAQRRGLEVELGRRAGDGAVPEEC